MSVRVTVQAVPKGVTVNPATLVVVVGSTHTIVYFVPVAVAALANVNFTFLGSEVVSSTRGAEFAKLWNVPRSSVVTFTSPLPSTSSNV